MFGQAHRRGWIEDFLYDRIHALGWSATTIQSIRIEINAWNRWLESMGVQWTGVTREIIRKWLTVHVDHASSTVAKKVWALRCLYRWALEAGYVHCDPWSSIARPRNQPRWQPRFTPSIEQIERLLVAPDTTTLIGIRDRTILELLYATGLRAAELLSLQCHQLATGDATRSIIVMGKGSKERCVVYCDVTRSWLRYYLRIVRPQLVAQSRSHQATDQLFIRPNRTPQLGYPDLRELVRRYAAAVDLPLITPHSLRHAFASHLYQAGANLRVIQMLLGHSSLVTTCVYARPIHAQLIRLLEEHHPRGSLYVPQRSERWHRDHSVGRATPSNDTDFGAFLRPPSTLTSRWLS